MGKVGIDFDDYKERILELKELLNSLSMPINEITEEEYDKALERVHKKINKILNDYFATHHLT